MAILKKLNEIRRRLEAIVREINHNLETRIEFEFSYAEYIASFGEEKIEETTTMKELEIEISKLSEQIGEKEGNIIVLLNEFENKIEELRTIVAT